GLPSFEKLQQYNLDKTGELHYYIFDLLSLDQYDLTSLTLVQRKELLREMIPQTSLLKYTDHIEQEGKKFFETCIQKGLEGIMAKKTDGLYYPGKRTDEWLKIKGFKT